MAVRIGDEAPDFTVDTTEGKIRFHEWIGDKWAILFSHPKDFTPVCTTELGYMAGLQPEFEKRNTKIIGLSVDPVSDHASWVKDIKETQGHAVNYPLIGDADLTVAKLYDMIHPNALGGKRTAADNATVRSVFVIGPDKKVKAMLVYPMSAGRNFDEVLRLLDSLQLNAKQVSAGVQDAEAVPAHGRSAEVGLRPNMEGAPRGALFSSNAHVLPQLPHALGPPGLRTARAPQGRPSPGHGRRLLQRRRQFAGSGPRVSRALAARACAHPPHRPRRSIGSLRCDRRTHRARR